jgi:hypothetical protein
VPADIWWADLIRARRALAPTNPAEWAEIARVLGHRVAAHQVGVTPPAPAAPAPAQSADTGADGRPDQAPWRGTVDRDADGDYADLPVLEPVAEHAVATPGPGDGEILPVPVADGTGGHRRRPLLAPRSTDAILQGLLSRAVPDGPPDIAAAIRAIVTATPVNSIPRLPVPTLRFGVQILVDVGDGMRPFRRDQADVVHAVRGVAGAGNTAVRYFAGVPTRGAGPGPRWTWRDYQAPAPGTPVLLLTDVGIGGDPFGARRVTRSEWIAFFDLLARCECRAVALVPYPSRRWPADLPARCAMLTWDRHTTVGHARMVNR